MNSSAGSHPGLNALIRMLGLSLVLLTAMAVPAHGICKYSGISIDAGGTIHGWGVTDATQPG